MTMPLDRRAFSTSLAASAFAGLAACARDGALRPPIATRFGYGPLVPDPAGLLDLPPGFSYRVISQFGDRMDDGYRTPDRFDGMGCFRIDATRVALVRNHELPVSRIVEGPFAVGASANVRSFDRTIAGDALPGGTTTLVYDMRSGMAEAQHLSLVGTIRNCAGGGTPWGSWLSCEEDTTRKGAGVTEDHGWIFEVPAGLRGLANPVPLKAMGRFNHEAAAVDPRSGIAYLTEDREDGLFYRFLPSVRGALASGGRLQALALDGIADTRNKTGIALPVQSWADARWIDLDDVEATGGDDLRKRGAAKGATLFARGEGVHFGRGELYFACTSGGATKLGQIMRYLPSRFEGQSGEGDEPGRLQNFVESNDPTKLNFGDNLTVAPNGHLIVCEDQYTDVVDNHLRGVTPDGRLYDIARLRTQTELAGACFSPDGKILFVNAYSPGQTLAITGNWA